MSTSVLGVQTPALDGSRPFRSFWCCFCEAELANYRDFLNHLDCITHLEHLMGCNLLSPKTYRLIYLLLHSEKHVCKMCNLIFYDAGDYIIHLNTTEHNKEKQTAATATQTDCSQIDTLAKTLMSSTEKASTKQIDNDVLEVHSNGHKSLKRFASTETQDYLDQHSSNEAVSSITSNNAGVWDNNSNYVEIKNLSKRRLCENVESNTKVEVDFALEEEVDFTLDQFDSNDCQFIEPEPKIIGSREMNLEHQMRSSEHEVGSSEDSHCRRVTKNVSGEIIDVSVLSNNFSFANGRCETFSVCSEHTKNSASTHKTSKETESVPDDSSSEYRCKLCLFVCGSESDLLLHEQDEHGIQDASETEYNPYGNRGQDKYCKICNVECVRYENHKSHSSHARNALQLFCLNSLGSLEESAENFPEGLLDDLRPPYLYRCDTCPKALNTVHDVQTHIFGRPHLKSQKECSVPESFSCLVCKVSFTNVDSLRVHASTDEHESFVEPIMRRNKEKQKKRRESRKI